METRNKDHVPFMAVPPGLGLKCELEERGIKQKDFAKQIGMQPSHLSELIKGSRAITAEIAVSFEAALGIPAKLWLDLQSGYEIDLINIAKRDEAEAEAGTALGVYDGVIGVREVLGRLFGREAFSFMRDRLNALRTVLDGDTAEEVATYGCGRFRKSELVGTDERMVRTWFVLARHKAKSITLDTPFDPTACADLPEKLRTALNTNEDTLAEVGRILSSYGIKFIVEQKQPKASVDGCSFETSDGHPCIAVSDRFDRIDWLAFTVLHELGHILSAGGVKGAGGIYRGKTDADEQEADRFAASTLIPDEVWRKAPPTKPDLRSLQSVYTRWAREVGINKWIVLGRVSHELGLYAIRSDRSRAIR